jgi:hypothetical protein
LLVVNVFAIFFGSLAGLVIGFFTGWLFVDFGWIPATMTWRAIIGAVTGGLSGGIAGSISGDLNRRGDSGANRFLVALVCGTIFGALGATKFTLLGELLESVNLRSPFN